uniref:inositol oxygenase n=1 Tax=Salix viminalis TaxID=40686 RepID=A0A6N2N7N9_SALVM
MTILISQPELSEDRKDNYDAKELVLDGGFVVPHKTEAFDAPEINSFGNSFRDYNAESERQKTVEEFYRQQHTNQTYDYVTKMREEYGKLDKAVMSIWDCCELLNDVVDDSDPDLDEPQIQHLLQSAEAIRKDYPDEDWLHLTALIHDLGKVLLLPQFGQLPQWAVVGDTFPLGCAFDESNVHHKYFKNNPDFKNPGYSSKNGIYKEGCGLDNVVISWGHDDYMYLVAKENGTTLPHAALFIIRYHSLYPLHKAGAYKHLMNKEDEEDLKWLNIFNKYDLYSKSKVLVDVDEVKPYYQSLIKKLKELEKSGPKKGVISQSVKDVVQSLVDDDLASKDKIGTSLRSVYRKLESDLQSSKKRHAELIDQCDELKKGREESDERETALAELKTIEMKYNELKDEMGKYADNDPAAFQAMKKAIEVAHVAANRWTDNIFTLRQWCSNNFPQAKEQLENMYQEAGITDEFDYLEVLPVIPLDSVTDQMLEGDP